MPEGIPRPELGTLALQATIQIDQIHEVGQTKYGMRRAMVLAGGNVTGSKLQGSILPGGLDYQLKLSNGVIEVEQILVLRTNEGKHIYVRNAGTGAHTDDVRIVFDFEAPNADTSSWLNNGKYVGRRMVDEASKTMTLSIYDVSSLPPGESASAVRISKPVGVPPQPWEYRIAAADEKLGDPIVTEFVSLGPSQQVGASKRGGRNIIPITGGTLSGRVTGKVVPAGADYQNFSNPPTIDARYLWQTDEGDIILVRNTGGFGSLVPTFEVPIASKYAWLNDGIYKSSNPGMGSGGVTITFYESK